MNGIRLLMGFALAGILGLCMGCNSTNTNARNPAGAQPKVPEAQWQALAQAQGQITTLTSSLAEKEKELAVAKAGILDLQTRLAKAEAALKTATEAKPATSGETAQTPAVVSNPPRVPAAVGGVVNGLNNITDLILIQPVQGDMKLEIANDWKSEGTGSMKVMAVVPDGRTMSYFRALNQRTEGAIPGRAGSMGPFDWSAYKLFKYDVHNAGAAPSDLETQVRNANNRSQDKITLGPGETKTVVIDLAKLAAEQNFDLKMIEAVNFLMFGPAGTKFTLYYDNIRLEK